MAKDKELNRWSSLKKAVQYRPEHVEKYDVVAFRKKAQNEYLKRKFIPSLFGSTEEEEPPRPTTSENETTAKNQTKKKQIPEQVADEEVISEKKKKGKKSESNEHNDEIKVEREPEVVKIKKGKKRKVEDVKEVECKIEANEKDNKSFDTSKVKKKKKKHGKTFSNSDIGITDARLEAYGINPKKYKNKLKYGNKNKVS